MMIFIYPLLSYLFLDWHALLEKNNEAKVDLQKSLKFQWNTRPNDNWSFLLFFPLLICFYQLTDSFSECL